MEEKKDSRRISYVEEFMPGGSLHEFTRLVKENSLLELCFRGNSGDVAIVYYNNHILFTIKPHGKGFNIGISFNHARYTEKWQVEEKKLMDLGFKKCGNTGRMQFTLSSSQGNVVDQAYDIMLPILKDYFYADKKIDFFRESKGEPQTGKNKPPYIEKIRQQELMRNLKNTGNGYFIYDLEFEQPYTDRGAKTADKNNNKPDMLAVKFKDSRPYRLVFIEVKSNYASCLNKSGFDEHFNKMREYIKQNANIEIRRKDALGIIRDYARLELRGLDKKAVLNDDDFLKLETEILFIFTDEAIGYYEENKSRISSREDMVMATFDENGSHQLRIL
jgi:hypothetical protein